MKKGKIRLILTTINKALEKALPFLGAVPPWVKAVVIGLGALITIALLVL